MNKEISSLRYANCDMLIAICQWRTNNYNTNKFDTNLNTMIFLNHRLKKNATMTKLFTIIRITKGIAAY